MNIIWDYDLKFVSEVLLIEKIIFYYNYSYSIEEAEHVFPNSKMIFIQKVDFKTLDRCSWGSNDLFEIIGVKHNVLPILERYKRLMLFI